MSMRALLEELLSDPDPLRRIAANELTVEGLLPHCRSEAEAARLLKVFAFAASRGGKPADALRMLDAAFSRERDLETLKNMAVVARSVPDGAEILLRIEALLAGEADSDAVAGVLDTLCHLAGHLKDLPRAVSLGRRSLAMKDALSSAAEPATGPRPRFDFMKPARNVVAFSLYGADKRYTLFATENMRALPHVLPGWSARFYVDDSVPETTVSALRGMGAQIATRPAHDREMNSGLFWRFDVANDPDVDFFLCRDCDSVLTVREKVAVDEWIASDALFHVLRDYYTHSELVLAGMWGGVAGCLPPMAELIATYRTETRGIVTVGARNQDQVFLRKHIWPRIKGSLLTHDSVFGFGPQGADVRDFPTVGAIHPVRHVGQNMAVFLKKS